MQALGGLKDGAWGGVDSPWFSAMSCSRGGPPPCMNVRTGRALKAQCWPNLFLCSRPSFSQNLQVPQTTRGHMELL